MTVERAAFERIRRLVHSQAGIVVDDGKEYLVEARLSALPQEFGLKRIEDVAERINTEPALATRVVEAMTTNETSFFRDHRPFEILRTDILPELLRRRAPRNTLEIWCAACASGQEPYSIAMLLREQFPELANWTIRILATDISHAILERAKAANFSQLEVNRGLSAAQLLKHFDRAGLHWVLKQDLKASVTFAHLNLIGQWPIMPRFDIVFIRNVLIYFDMDTKRLVLNRVGGQLSADGYVFLGGGETLIDTDSPFERMNFERASCYRLVSGKQRANLSAAPGRE